MQLNFLRVERYFALLPCGFKVAVSRHLSMRLGSWFVLTHFTHLQHTLLQVNSLLSVLEKDVKKNPTNSRHRVMSYMNACCSNQTVGVPPDEHFGATIVGCTLDDQKEAKKRIEFLLEYVDQRSWSLCFFQHSFGSVPSCLLLLLL